MSRRDWFVIGERILVEGGASGLTVEGLTTLAGVTKGSFYHHFGSWDGFIEAFLGHLRSRAFADVVAVVDLGADPQTRIRQLTAEIAELDPTLEIAVRRWAAGNQTVEAIVRQVDQERFDFIEALLAEIADSPRAATRLARLHLTLYLGTLMMDPPVRGKEYLGMIEALDVLLAGTARLR